MKDCKQLQIKIGLRNKSNHFQLLGNQFQSSMIEVTNSCVDLKRTHSLRSSGCTQTSRQKKSARREPVIAPPVFLIQKPDPWIFSAVIRTRCACRLVSPSNYTDGWLLSLSLSLSLCPLSSPLRFNSLETPRAS